MKRIPDQIKTAEDLEFCRATNTIIYVFSINDLQNVVFSGQITNGSILPDFIEIDGTKFDTSNHVFLTEQ